MEILSPLKRQVLVTLSLKYWRYDDITDLLDNFEFGSLDSGKNSADFRSQIEEEVIKRANELQRTFPAPLYEEFIRFIKYIGTEILRWGQFHITAFGDEQLVKLGLGDLRWTTQGTINKKGTAQHLIIRQELDVKVRFKLACVYCLESYILDLWQMLPLHYRRELSSVRSAERHRIVRYWVNKILVSAGEPAIRNYSYATNLLPYATYRGNLAATQYFFNKLTPTEIIVCSIKIITDIVSRCCNENSFVVEFPKESYGEVLLYLLARTFEEYLIVLFHKNHKILECFLKWPLNLDFKYAAKLSLVSFSKQDFCSMLKEIIKKMKESRHVNHYPINFNEFYDLGPQHYKSFFMKKCVTTSILEDLVKFGCKTNLETILKNTDDQERMKFFRSMKGKGFCQQLMYDERWDWLQLYADFMPSQAKARKFIKTFKEYYNRYKFYTVEEKEDPTWNRFVQLINEVLETKRRILREDTSAPYQRLRSRYRL